MVHRATALYGEVLLTRCQPSIDALTGEGGTRVRAFVHSPNLLPANFAGTSYDGIISASDIFPTFCAVAGVNLREFLSK